MGNTEHSSKFGDSTPKAVKTDDFEDGRFCELGLRVFRPLDGLNSMLSSIVEIVFVGTPLEIADPAVAFNAIKVSPDHSLGAKTSEGFQDKDVDPSAYYCSVRSQIDLAVPAAMRPSRNRTWLSP